MMDVQPSISVLNHAQKEQVHAYAKELLDTVGMRVDCPRARDLLAHKGGRQLVDNRIAIPGELIDWAIQAAPETIAIFDRTSAPAFTLGAEDARTRFGIGVTNLYYQDPGTDGVTPFTL
jgi:trimethylamine:corrinoid methyltransferase-like protein